MGYKMKFKFSIHLLVLAIIVVIFGTAIFILLRWNVGTDSEYDPSMISEEFDEEEMDIIMPMLASDLEGKLDDGETTIVCLGNNPFTDERGENGLAAQIAEKTGATVYNAAFPDSVVVCKYPVYDPYYTRDVFNLYYVTQALINGQYSPQASAAEYEEDSKYKEAVQEMIKIDMDKVDIILLMYDTTDYNTLSTADNPNNEYDVTAFTGALRTSIENVQEAYPHIRIFLMSHTYARHRDDKGKLHNGTITDLGNGTVPHYLIMGYDVALSCGISFIDNYFGTIHEGNYQEYMIDHMHYNDAGRELLAQRIADIINREKGEK